MDESKFTASCGRHSFYISLQDQENAVTRFKGTARPSLRRAVSKEQITRIHFIVHHNQHWAAVQISISPFEIRSIQKQKFFQCCLRYTWCCETAQGTSTSCELSHAVQRVYDFYYRPTDWDFSSKYCYSIDPPNPPSSWGETTCAKKVESALASYIQRGNDQDGQETPLKIFDLNDVNDSAANQSKRRRPGASAESHDDHGEDDSTTDNDPAEDASHESNLESSEYDGVTPSRIGVRIKRRRLDIINCNEIHGDVDTSNAVEVQSTGHSSISLNEEETREAQAVKTISNKIRKGLDEIKAALEKSNNKQCADLVVVGDQVIPQDFNNWFERGESNIKDLEDLLWDQSSKVVRNALGVAWKCSFIAVCLRKIRQPSSAYEITRASQRTISRWTVAASMINSIVDGLWVTWGPRAALVYEAFAFKNFVMSNITDLADSMLPNIIQGVIENIAKDPPLPALLDSYVFHPAACISIALNLNYKQVCVDLGLGRSFYKVDLDLPRNLQMHASLPLLSNQWDRYLATLPADTATRFQGCDGQGVSNSSPFDTLAAVAVAEIDRHANSAVGTAQSIDQLQESLRRNSVQCFSSQNQFNDELALSIPDRHSTLHTVDNTYQGVVRPNERLLGEREIEFPGVGDVTSLHFWQGSGPGLYEPLELLGAGGGDVTSLHLWQGSGPGLFEPLELLGAGDGDVNSLHFWEGSGRGLHEPLEFWDVNNGNRPTLYEPLELVDPVQVQQNGY